MFLVNYVRGNYLLFKFFFSQMSFIATLPESIRDPDSLHAVVSPLDQEGSCSVRWSCDAVGVNNYNASIEALKKQIKLLSTDWPFKVTQLTFFIVRVFALIASFGGDLRSTFAISAVQFLVAPYSFFVCVAQICALIPPMFFGHYLGFGFLRLVEVWLLPDWSLLEFSITPSFICAFFLFDQAVCAYLVFFDTTDGKPVKIPFLKAIKHISYGFLNCKTYTLIIFLHMYHSGVRFSFTVWMLDCVFRISPRIARTFTLATLHWAAIFYHQHRMAHIPRVYEHAHKMHHFLYDATAFDAHFYGSGAPEEFCMLFVEVLGGVFGGILPLSLSFHTLYLSWTNKTGHTRKAEAHGGNNNHCDHHTYHSKNFGIYNLTMDLLFGTNADTGLPIEIGSYILTRAEEQGRITLELNPIPTRAGTAHAGSACNDKVKGE
jgi:hypothetical protein